MFSWLDSYDIFDEAGNTVYTVKSKLAWGHCLRIYDANGNHIATVTQKLFTFFIQNDYIDGSCLRQG